MSVPFNGMNALPRRCLCSTLILLAYAIALAGASTAQSGERKLSGPQIRTAISGKEVSDGRHWSHYYLTNGQLERAENGRSRSGNWNVIGDQLCLLLPEVSKKEPICFDVMQIEGELQYRDERSVVYQGAVRPRSTKR